MARLNGTTAPATAPSAHTSSGEDQLTPEAFEAGEQQHILVERAAMRPKPRRDITNLVADNEEVKRGLMRQNRNLARSHSAQSLQIRTLGTQISNLLASNTALKEENIRLRRDLSNAQDLAIKDGIDNLKDVLNARLRDMAALVSNLGNHTVHTISPQASPETRKSICLESMQFRDRPSLREIMSETQLPAIEETQVVEEEDEPVRLSAELDSPDLGPAPVARLDFDASCELPLPAAEINMDANTSINVDTRRKRKDSDGASQTRRRSALVTPLLELEKSATISKTGAKRKISDRDRDDAVSTEDAFQYSRKPKDANVEVSLPASADEEQTAKTRRPARKVLGDKSTNFSPKKARILGDEEKGDQSDEPSKKSSRRSSRQSRIAIPILREIDILPAAEIELAATTGSFPKTPAASQILSPNSSEPASRGVGKADTPPPGELSLASSTTSMEGARPSRRARAAVNYAEPSLVAKMRRPGKEMLDALSGLQDPRNVMNSSRRTSEDVMVKALFKDDSQAHTKRSPLIKKTEQDGVEELELSPVEERQSCLSLGALMAGSKSRTETVPVQELDIFDFKDTSPPDSPEAAIERNETSQRRRHSAVSKASDKTALSKEAASTFGRSSAAVRRRSMMV